MNEGIELLAPAGGMEGLRACARFGADAVYLGGPMLQLRAGQTGFSLGDIAQAAAFLHARGKKLYVAANAFVFPEEMPDMADYARALSDAGADAMIVSDLGAMRAILRACPRMPVHVSTQANCTNHETATAYYETGASRVVLARELRIDQIAEIRARTPGELALEAFVHGAMCMAYSGRCLLSTYFTGRSANRGGCAQSCRWTYALQEEKRPGQYFPVEEDARGTTILSSYDLCALGVLRDLIRAGVTSLKIEGRMKTPYYAATVVNAYRMALSGEDEAACMAELESVSHRPYCAGFYLGPMREAHAEAGYLHTREYVGPVLERRGNRILAEVKNKLTAGQMAEAVTPGRPGMAFEARDLQTEDGRALLAAGVPGMRFTLPAPPGVGAGDYLRRACEGGA